MNRGQVGADDFELHEGGAVSLKADARKAVIVAFQERKQEEITHPVLKEPVPLGLVPLVQARLLARAIRADGTMATAVPATSAALPEAGGSAVAPYLPFVPR